MPRLKTEHLNAIELLAQGLTEEEVAQFCHKSRSWVQNVKRREDYPRLLEEAKQRLNSGSGGMLAIPAVAFSEDGGLEIKDLLNEDFSPGMMDIYSSNPQTYTQALENYKIENQAMSRLILRISRSLLLKLEARLNEVEAADFSISKLPGNIKLAISCINTARSMSAEFAAVQKVMEYVEKDWRLEAENEEEDLSLEAENRFNPLAG